MYSPLKLDITTRIVYFNDNQLCILATVRIRMFYDSQN